MVHRPIFLGISTDMSPDNKMLNLCITINDGFFVLGTKNYGFPIISSEEESPTTTSSGLSPSPQMSLTADEDVSMDDEFEEIKGMYIDINKKVVVKKSPSSTIYSEEKTFNPETHAKVMCQTGSDSKPGSCFAMIKDNGISHFSKAIKKEAKKDIRANGEISLFQYIDNETLETFAHILLLALDKWIGEYSKGSVVKIVGAGISTTVFLLADFSEKIKALLWHKYDIFPCFFSGDEKPLDQQSESLARKCANLFGQENLPRLSIGDGNMVNVDSGNIWFSSLKQYVTYAGLSWSVIEDMYTLAKDLETCKISFFSSTPQGGGVSLMRHALIRLFTMIGIDAEWYVCVPSPSVFKITKKKIHNILQGVAPEETELTTQDQNKIDKWLKNNYETNWRSAIKKSTFIVLDDYQVAGMVPFIKRDNPTAKIIYRSHIQIKTESFSTCPQMQNVWDYLWKSLKDVDYFVSHPIPDAVPTDVPSHKVLYQPASTDPLDGLNKEISLSTNTYYQNVFNRICIDNGENPIDFSRPYIVQIARFDPSKGFADLLDSYYKLYQKYVKEDREEKFDVGLVLCGHGSVDDPEGTQVFKQISCIVESEKFMIIKSLITKVRLPPSDQLLNMVLKNARVCCQLSICEGYEVKVTESLMKRVPVVVYNTGGLPLQVRDKINGYIVERGDTERVSEHLYTLLYNNEVYRKMLQNIEPKRALYITTPFQALFWMTLAKISTTPGSVPKTKHMYREFKEKYFGDSQEIEKNQ